MIQHEGSRSNDVGWCHVIHYLGRCHLIVHKRVFFFDQTIIYLGTVQTYFTDPEVDAPTIAPGSES